MTGSPRSTHVVGETVAGSANADPCRGGGAVVDVVVDGAAGAGDGLTGAAAAGDGPCVRLVPTPTRNATTRKTGTPTATRRRRRALAGNRRGGPAGAAVGEAVDVVGDRPGVGRAWLCMAEEERLKPPLPSVAPSVALPAAPTPAAAAGIKQST
ncbi:MAG TPA: hypothetical protein VGG23_01180, partial [Acidimicrobiales bacterium]